MKKLAIRIVISVLISALLWIFLGGKENPKYFENLSGNDLKIKTEKVVPSTQISEKTSLKTEKANRVKSEIVPKNKGALEITFSSNEHSKSSDIAKSDFSKNGPPEIKLDGDDNPIVDKNGNPANL